MVDLNQVKNAYQSAISKTGIWVDILINKGPDDWEVHPVRCVMRGFRPDELINGIDQNDIKMVILAEDMPVAELRRVDRVKTKAGAEYSVIKGDYMTRTYGDVTIAVEVVVRG